MLGLSRHVYVLATNRQIPSWLGKLSSRRSTPHIAIVAARVICVGLVLPDDIRFLAGVYAFGATLAISIAHAVDRPAADHDARARAALPDPAQRPHRRPPAAAAGDLRRRC